MIDRIHRYIVNEPVRAFVIVRELVTVAVAGAVVFGVPLTDDQQAWLLGLSAVVAGWVGARRVRGRVTPEHRAAARVHAAAAARVDNQHAAGYLAGWNDAEKRILAERPR